MRFSPPSQAAPVIVQGVTGRFGRLHAAQMSAYGTRVVGGVTPGKGGQSLEGLPVYDTVREALLETGAEASVLFVPAPSLLSAAEEAISAGVKFLVPITEHVPIRDTLAVLESAGRRGAQVVGPNTAGIVMPSKRVKLGIMPAAPFAPGGVALFSRSGSLMYEVADFLTASGLGQHIAMGVGGDPINCTSLNDCLDWAAVTTEVNSVVVVGEIGGAAEEHLAEHIATTGFAKPVVAYIAGRTAPREKRMGHAGAIIQGEFGTAESKATALRKAGVAVAERPSEIPGLVDRAMRQTGGVRSQKSP